MHILMERKEEAENMGARLLVVFFRQTNSQITMELTQKWISLFLDSQNVN